MQRQDLARSLARSPAQTVRTVCPLDGRQLDPHSRDQAIRPRRRLAANVSPRSRSGETRCRYGRRLWRLAGRQDAAARDRRRKGYEARRARRPFAQAAVGPDEVRPGADGVRDQVPRCARGSIGAGGGACGCCRRNGPDLARGGFAVDRHGASALCRYCLDAVDFTRVNSARRRDRRRKERFDHDGPPGPSRTRGRRRTLGSVVPALFASDR